MTAPHPAPALALPDATRAAVNLLAGAAFFSGAALRICDGLIPRIAADFHLSAGQAGRVVLTFAVAYALMQLVFGPLGDRYGKARMVACALAGCTLLSVAAALAPDFGTLLVARGAWGMAAAGVIPLAIAWIGDAVPYEQRQATLARLLLGTLSGMMAGQLCGGLFADSAWGWRGAFFALGAGYAAIAALLLARLRTMPRPLASSTAPASFLGGLQTVLSLPWSYWVLGAALAEGVLLLGAMAYLPAYLHARHGLSLSAASALLALNAVGGLAYSVFARTIVRRLGERRMILAGGMTMGLGYLAFLLLPIAWLAAPVALAVGFGTYLFHNTLQTHATQMAPASRGSAVALFAFCLFLGNAIGVSVAGHSWDHLGAAALLLPPALLLPFVGWAFARALLRHTKVP